MKLAHRLAAIAALLAAPLGCGTSDEGREPVTGTITLDGQPLPDGSLTLVPLAAGPTVGATILDGNFAIARPDGPLPGAYRVEILSIRSTGRTIPDPEGPKGTTVAERKNVVPDRYGSRSELRAEVTPAGPNTFRFEIDSKPDRLAAKNRR